MASPDASGVPAGSIGASTPLPPEADSAAARRSWGKNVREVGSDAELREALLEAGPQTVRAAALLSPSPCAHSAHERRLLLTSARRGARSARRSSPSWRTWASRHAPPHTLCVSRVR
jgi:hypothetical protein